jgi:hypothetical protein
VIAFNGRDGVRIAGLADARNTVRANRIFSNGGLGINLGHDGVTPNDLSDQDTGPNLLQNFPTLTSALADAEDTTITGVLNSAPSSTFLIEFFVSESCDTSGFGEGALTFGSVSTFTDASGNATFSHTLPIVPIGHTITSTATDQGGNTSEFSKCIVAGPVLPADIPVDSRWAMLILAVTLGMLGFWAARR